MKDYSIFEKYNHLTGDILDCSFTSFSEATNYIDLALGGTLEKRNYYIIKTFDSSPWQQAYDFTNSIKNRLKKNSVLVKEVLNESYLKSFSNIAIAIINFDTVNLDMLKILYSYVNNGGIISIETQQNKTGIIKILSETYSRKQIVIEESSIILHKNSVNNNGKIQRTKSILT